MLSDISIEPFRGDIEGLEKMAFSSWRDEYGIESFPNFYRPAFLKYLFGHIQDERALIAAYRGDEVVSFLANLPRHFSFKGKKYYAALSCIMVTRKELLRRGLGLAIIREGLKFNKELKYDFTLFTLESGHRSSLMIKKLEESGDPVKFVKRMYVVARVLDLERASVSEGLKSWEKVAIKIIGAHRHPKTNSSVSVREYRPEDIEACLNLLNQYKEHVGLARVWERDELAWELDYPDVSKTLVYEKSGRVEGLINYILYEHIGKTKERWAWINHVAYPTLSGRERVGFINAFLHYIKESNCIGALEFTKKYYPMAPLYKAHFFPYFRSVKMVSWSFNPDVVIENIPDVYEVQI